VITADFSPGAGAGSPQGHALLAHSISLRAGRPVPYADWTAYTDQELADLCHWARATLIAACAAAGQDPAGLHPAPGFLEGPYRKHWNDCRSFISAPACQRAGVTVCCRFCLRALAAVLFGLTAQAVTDVAGGDPEFAALMAAGGMLPECPVQDGR
jgi:hypothetical protein